LATGAAGSAGQVDAWAPSPRRVTPPAVAPAVAQAAVDDGVARVKDFDVKAYTEKLAKGL